MPVITTDCMGPTEYIDESNGLICMVDDDEDMARAILELYENYNKYDANILRKSARKYSSDEVVKMAEKIYKRVVGK